MESLIAIILLKAYAGIGFILFVTNKQNVEGGDLKVVGRGVLYSFTWPWHLWKR